MDVETALRDTILGMVPLNARDEGEKVETIGDISRRLRLQQLQIFSSWTFLKMKIVALLSGGKDSCYNLVHCAANGHELVAAASLGPGAGKGE